MLFIRWASKVDIGDGTGCWFWTGAKSKGYGIMSNPDAKSPLKAHRLSYEFFKGNIGAGMVVRHGCDKPSCVNPHHLTVGTQSENMKDASLRGRLNIKSLANLRPGHPGFHGAGPISAGER